jgi:hypothetical protein
MSKFLKHLFIFCSILFVIFSTLGFAIDSGLKKSGIDNFPEWNDMRNGVINADLIVAGSSRAWVHISPFILDTALQLRTYNLGLDGYHFEAQHMRYKFYEKYNGKPQFIIHSLDVDMLTEEKELYMREQFAPYLTDSIIREGIKNYQGFSRIDYLNPFTKYQYSFRHIGIGLMEFFRIKHFDKAKYKGYQATARRWDHSFERLRKRSPQGLTIQLDKKQLALFDSYLAACKKKRISVVLVYTPEYIEAQHFIKNRRDIILIYEKFAKKYNFPFLDYSDNALSYKKDYFYNSQHMNKRGSELFSINLANDLKKLLKCRFTRSNDVGKPKKGS